MRRKSRNSQLEENQENWLPADLFQKKKKIAKRISPNIQKTIKERTLKYQERRKNMIRKNMVLKEVFKIITLQWGKVKRWKDR